MYAVKCLIYINILFFVFSMQSFADETHVPNIRPFGLLFAFHTFFSQICNHCSCTKVSDNDPLDLLIIMA